MSDIEILRSGETMVSAASGLTDAGVEFVDGYMPSREGAELAVVDSGKIILANGDVDEFVSACQQQGLTIERTEGI